MKTIKQIADELGVNKQKVYRFIVKNHITASSEVKQSKLYDEAAERLIKSHFDRITTSCERSSEPHQKSGNEMLLEQLIKELEVKNEQQALDYSTLMRSKSPKGSKPHYAH
jgi:predicted site-specific integrase-resolvase